MVQRAAAACARCVYFARAASVGVCRGVAAGPASGRVGAAFFICVTLRLLRAGLEIA